MNNLKRDLLNTRDVIVSGWCQEHYATNDQGMEVSMGSENAKCFCLSGGIQHVLRDVNHVEANERFQACASALMDEMNGNEPPKYLCIIDWNDEKGRTKEQVIALLDTTIARLT